METDISFLTIASRQFDTTITYLDETREAMEIYKNRPTQERKVRRNYPMRNTLIQNVRICLEDGRMIDGEILIKGGKIHEISERRILVAAEETIDATGLIAIPGFIDIHIHGAVGADFMDGTVEAACKIATYLPSEGTTSYLATTLTQSSEAIKNAIAANRQMLEKQHPFGAEMLGFHLEGPFIHSEQAGAQPKQFIQAPSSELLKEWFGDKLENLKIVTLAPELDKQFDLIRMLSKKGIISSAGHSKASFQEISDAMEVGLSHLTHYANAMTGLHHREVGMVGAGLLLDELYCEVIADGVHLSEDMLRLLVKIIGSERMVLITDSMRAKGLSDGSYTLADQQVQVYEQKAVLEDGTLAGSVLRMNEGVARMQRISAWSMEELIRISSKNAAKRLGVYDRKGSITVGKDADIILVNDVFKVYYTFCKGGLSYSNEAK